MPNMNGFDLLAAIKADHELKNVPVLMVTVEGRDDDVARAMEAGAAACIVKPFTRAALEERVAALEGGRAALACATGMAAQMVALLTLAHHGDHIVAAGDFFVPGLSTGTPAADMRQMFELHCDPTTGIWTRHDIGGNDEVHGETGDDFIYVGGGSDIAFGDADSDDIIGGWGSDWAIQGCWR